MLKFLYQIKNIEGMDSTHLYKTGRTAETTVLYPPGAVLDQSFQSQPRVFNSRVVMQPRIQQSVFHTIPAQPRVIALEPRQTFHSVRTISAPPARTFVGPRPVLTINDQISVYCPVCRRDYYNSQVQEHAMIHDAAHKYNFKIEDQYKDLNMTQDSIDDHTHAAAPDTNALTNIVQYPLIQPLEFWTNELKDSAKNDVFIFKDNKNYDGVDRSIFDMMMPKPITAPTAKYVESQTQTFRKPPLQYESNDTNLYNFLDNAVNSKNGPKFSMNDVLKNNKVITPKRNLEDWEIMEKNLAETYTKPRTVARV